MPGELAQLVRSFAGRRVLVAGDMILDRYLYGDAERISPEAPVPVLRVRETREAVGGSANVAACAAALGCKVSCAGLLGTDAHGRQLRDLMSALGVDASGVLEAPERPTTTKTRLVGLAQHRHRQQLLRLDEEDTRPLSADLARNLRERVHRMVDSHDVVCIEDYDKGVVTTEFVEAVTSAARKHGRTILVDPARLRDYSRYRGADVLTPNRDELSIATGRPLDSVEAVARAGEEVLERYGFSAVVATVDRDGAVLVEQGQNWRHVPTVPRSVYDNTGAGDAVLAMLAAALAAGADLHAAVRLANMAGGLEVEKFGCVPITADEVLAELRLEDRRQNGKLRSVEELVAELAIRRDRGETVAFTNGCFDVLHAGHVDYLQRARREATMLVIGLNGDSSVRALGKAGDRPVNRFEHRAAVLSALECVDYVVGFDDPTPESLIRRIRPDVLVKGEDWAARGVVGREFVESIGGKVLLLPLVEGLSTSALIERIRGGA